MSLTDSDLKSIKKVIDTSIDSKLPPILHSEVPKIVSPMLEELEHMINGAFQVTQNQVSNLQDDMTEVKHDLKYIKVAVHRLEIRGTLKT